VLSIRFIGILVLAGLGCAAAFAQLSQTPSAGRQLPEYVLGPSDEILIMALDIDEISNKTLRIGTSGDINLPLVGRIHAAGLTVQQLEHELTDRLKEYIREPQIAVSITQFKSQPVSVWGAVGSPGVVQLEGRKTLLEVLSAVGGTRSDASYRVTITRTKEWGPIPLPTATTDPASPYSVAEVNIRTILDASHPEQNIQILPYDVISVPRAQVVYALGQVRKPGGFVLNDRDTMSVLQLLAMAEGVGPTAAPKDAKIIRPVPGAERIEIAVNVKDMLEGKTKDLILQPEDMLFIPDSYTKGALRRTLDSVIQMTTGMIIYR
jgi:polysaccharide export outer membrane protein